MAAMEQLQTWRTEIEAELEAANHDLATAAEALPPAQLARDQAHAALRSGAALLEGLAGDREDNLYWGQPSAGIPSVLTAQLEPLKRAAHKAEGALSLAKQCVVSAQHLVDDIKDALERLNRAMTPVEEAPESETVS